MGLKDFLSGKLILTACFILSVGSMKAQSADTANDFVLNLRYSPAWWQTLICLPDDPLKTIVGKEGQMYYDYIRGWKKGVNPGPYRNFNTVIELKVPEGVSWMNQKIHSDKVPIIETIYSNDKIDITEDAFAVAPPFESSEKNFLGFKTEYDSIIGAPRNDIMLITYSNKTGQEMEITPEIIVNSIDSVVIDKKNNFVHIGSHIRLVFTSSIYDYEYSFSTKTINKIEFIGKDLKEIPTEVRSKKYVIKFNPYKLTPYGGYSLAVGVCAGKDAVICPENVKEALLLKQKSEDYWQGLALAYNRISIPDSALQVLLNSAVRNIYQAREIRKGLLAFQVGPTCYRDIWLVDGSFIFETMTMMGLREEVKNGLDYMFSFQRKNGAIMLIGDDWKETGLALWAVSRYARLTGDKEWLEQKWENVRKLFGFIEQMRAMTNPGEPNAGLVPAGFSDGGLDGKYYEYTNVYWTLIGMKAAADLASWAGKKDDAEKWKKEYDDMYAIFRKAAERDAKVDEFGNRYIPVRMIENKDLPPQKAQWAFVQAIYPGMIFPKDDELVKSSMAMLKATEKEGLIYNTAWLRGLWVHFGSFYGHALLWLGDGETAAKKLYAFANHAAPTLVWREEQTLKGAKYYNEGGDMPHNWASAEILRFTRHLLVFERGDELHLLEGIPPAWTKPGMVTKLDGIYTEFGIIKLSLEISKDGSAAQLDVELDSLRHQLPKATIVHLKNITGKDENMIISKFPIHQKIKFTD